MKTFIPAIQKERKLTNRNKTPIGRLASSLLHTPDKSKAITLLAGVILFIAMVVCSQTLSIKLQYDGSESVTTFTNSFLAISTPPSVTGEKSKLFAVVMPGATTVKGSPKNIVIKASYPTSNYWRYEYSTNATDWLMLANCEKQGNATNWWTPEIVWPSPPSPLFLRLAETVAFSTTVLTNAP